MNNEKLNNEQRQGEPVAWRVGSQIFQQEHLAKMHSGGVRKPVEPLYIHADPADVEWLQVELTEAKADASRARLGHRQLCAKHAEILAERDTLRDHLSEAHAVLDHISGDYTGETERRIKRCLSASAERNQRNTPLTTTKG